MIEYPLEVVQKRREERSVMARALLDFELLLGHLRSCADCYDGACLTTAHQIKATQAVTERARKIAREVLGEPVHG